MFADERKTRERMAPRLQRALIVEPQPGVLQAVAEAMRANFDGQIWTACTQARAFSICERLDPQMIFVAGGDPGLDGEGFVRTLRRSAFGCRKAPVVTVMAGAPAAAILKARDAGVHEFLTGPLTAKNLLRCLEAALLRERDWIEAVDYVGPDRRRFSSGDYSGPFKRRDDPAPPSDAERLARCLAILRAAVGAIEADPAQARRAIDCQLEEIGRLTASTVDGKLTAVLSEMQRYIARATDQDQPLARAELQRRAAALLAFAPKDRPAAA